MRKSSLFYTTRKLRHKYLTKQEIKTLALIELKGVKDVEDNNHIGKSLKQW